MLKGCMVKVRLGTRDLHFVQMNDDFALLQVPKSGVFNKPVSPAASTSFPTNMEHF